MRRASLLLLLLWLPTATFAQTSPPPTELNRVVAVVNNDVVLQSELSERIKTTEAQLKKQSTPIPPPNVLRRQVLERLIMERLQLQLAEKNGIRVDDEGLNKALRRIAEQNKVTLPEFKKILEKEGYSFPAFREELRAELTIGELRRRQVENRIQITDREIDNVLLTAASQANADDEYRVGHILVGVREGASTSEVEAARTRAESTLQELRRGADFSEVAVARSEGERNLEGGDLGWRHLSQLPAVVADSVMRLKQGQVSDLIRDPAGFHIVKVLDVRRGQRLVVNQAHVRHIVLRPDQTHTEDAVRTRLEQLRRRVQGGESFAELARAHSADAPSAARGGDLGWLNPGDVVPEFERVVSGLQPGEISEPFRTQFGWHIAQVIERRQHDSTDEVRRARARDYVRQRKVDEETQIWARRLRDEAYVEIRPEE